MTFENLIIRRLEKLDLPLLLELWQKSGLPFRPKGRDRINKIELELNNNFEALIGAFHETELIAFVLASHDGRKGWINRLAVHPDYRGKGLAKKMIAEAEKFLSAQEIEIFTCLIEDWNKNSLELFNNLGYKEHRDIIYFSKRMNPDV